MNINRWLKDNTSTLAGKTIAISGATGGLGKPLCQRLAALGVSLILLDRNPARSQALADELLVTFPKLSVKRIPLDLERIDSVKACAERLLTEEIDGLILNAGAYRIERHTCKGGYDNVFMINFASPYFLAKRLLPMLEARKGKLVVVGSVAHTYSKSDPEDVDFSTRTKHSLCYGNAKRHLMYAAYKLCEGKNLLAVTHPGIAVTNITSHYPKLIYALIKYPMKVIFMSPKKASLSILRGLFDSTSEGEWIGPRYFSVWGLPKKDVLKKYDEEEAVRLFAKAEEIDSALNALPKDSLTCE